MTRCAVRTTCLAVLAASIASATVVAAPPAAAPPSAAIVHTGPAFCGEVLRLLTGTRLPLRNTVQAALAEFVAAKPSVAPLETRQWVEYEDAARTRPMLVACKTKSSDHLRAVHGTAAAPRTGSSCRDVQRAVVAATWAALPARERRTARWPPAQLMLDPDDLGVLGSEFVKPYEFLYPGADGRPHLRAKAQFTAWGDWRWKFMPARFRGTHYCRVVAPEHVARLIRGELVLAPPPRA